MRYWHIVLLLVVIVAGLGGALSAPERFPVLNIYAQGEMVPGIDTETLKYRAQTSPERTFSPSRLPPGTACFHLNYEGPGTEPEWQLEQIIREISRRSDCIVVYWQHLGGDLETCKAVSSHFFQLLIDYGFSQIYVRIAAKMPGSYLNQFCYGPGARSFPGSWCYGGTGLPAGVAGDPVSGFVPQEGDIIAGRLYFPSLQECWRNSYVRWKRRTLSVADFFAESLVYVQVYNEVDFEHEWDEPLIVNGEKQFKDLNGDGYAEFTGDYYLLGHLACSLTSGFSWFLKPPERVVTVIPCGEYPCYDFNSTHPRVPILIPPVGTGNTESIRQYLYGCLDSFHKIPIPDYPVMGGYYSPFYGPGVVAYSAHLYAPCAGAGYDGAQKVVDDIARIYEIIAEWNASNKFPTPVRVVVTEFGCAQVGAPAGRVQQKNLYDRVIGNVIGTPVAWWIGAGRSCHPPTDSTTGRNQPDDWDVMAIVDYQGHICDLSQTE